MPRRSMANSLADGRERWIGRFDEGTALVGDKQYATTTTPIDLEKTAAGRSEILSVNVHRF